VQRAAYHSHVAVEPVEVLELTEPTESHSCPTGADRDSHPGPSALHVVPHVSAPVQCAASVDSTVLGSEDVIPIDANANAMVSPSRFPIAPERCKSSDDIGLNVLPRMCSRRSGWSDMFSRSMPDLSVDRIGALKLYSVTEESLPFQKLLVQYNRWYHRQARATCVCLLVSFMSAFTLWSVYKIARGNAYMEIHREDKVWNGPAALPRVAVANVRLPSNFTFTARSMSVRDGDFSTLTVEPIQTMPCDISVGGLSKRLHVGDAMCMPAGLEVQGIFGDPVYSYVELAFYLPFGAPKQDGSVSLVIEDRPTQYSQVFFSHYYTFIASHWTGVEVFFRKVVALSGEPLGLFGHTGNDELEGALPTKVYSTYSHEYTRFTALEETMQEGRNATCKVLTFYLRASLTETEEFYEVYSVIKLLEKAGGLWISLGLVLSTLLLLCFSAHRRLALLCGSDPISAV